ncbi:MAG: hypothetical protein JW870_03635 [Candidatus Delongbacteria bacterium]|nr:hypothetical protein [Candidatus Delongbacteria bacterium]
MKTKKLIYGLVIVTAFTSCVSQSDYDKLKSENEKLKIELDDCLHGAEKLIANAEKSYLEKNYSDAKKNIELLAEKHPESPKNKEFLVLLKNIESLELQQQKMKDAEEKERIRLENLNNTGIWTVQYYVDDFGEPTKEGYIRNTNLINGTFSNTATQNSALNVKILITNSNDINIMLYEYAGNNPVKAYSSESYQVLVQDKDGNRLKLRATNYSDRLNFDKTASKQVHNILMKGGCIKFKIFEIDTPTTEYDFTINNADWYENAYAKLKETK